MKFGRPVFLFVCVLIAAWPLHAGERTNEVKVAFIYPGPAGKAGWFFAHDEGRRHLERTLPGVKTACMESVPAGAEAEAVMTRFAQEGYRIIFAASRIYEGAVESVARKFPDAYFECCACTVTRPNVSPEDGRLYEVQYLSGVVAGKITGTGKIGYDAEKPAPEIIRGINAVARGARSVSPSVRVIVVWRGAESGSDSGKKVVEKLSEEGCDVIFSDSPAVLLEAAQRGKHAISSNAPMEGSTPTAVLTGPVWNWGPYYVRRVKAVLDGTWKAEQYWGPMSDHIVGLAPPSGAVPPDAVRLVEKKKKEIEQGRLHPFAGPVKDNQGRLLVPRGKTVSDREMRIFGWFVEGVEGRFLGSFR